MAWPSGNVSTNLPSRAKGAMSWPGAPVTVSTNHTFMPEGTMSWPSGTVSTNLPSASKGAMSWPAGEISSSTNHPASAAEGTMGWPGKESPLSDATAEGGMEWPGHTTPPLTNGPAIPAPDANAPWTGHAVPAAATSAPISTNAAAPAAVTEQTAPAPAEQTPVATVPPPPPTAQSEATSTNAANPASFQEFSMTPPPMLQPPKATKNEISASGDMMFGSGTVSLPLGYSLTKGGILSQETAFTVPRNSLYYGGTLSYSHGQAWYVDASIAQGHSSGSQSIATGFLGDIDSTFSIDDTWYQVYLKYTFPQLRGRRFSAYLRGGGTYISSTLNDSAKSGAYSQKDDTQEYRGNLGFGLAYSLYSTRRLRFDLQAEGEGFYGERSQQSTESPGSGYTAPQDNINNTVYGGIGRATLGVEYRLGSSGLLKLFGEVGAEVDYTLVQYPNGGGSHDEDLWGPYLKLGLRYAF